MKKSSIILDFLKNFCIGGTIIGLYSVIIKYISPVLAGHMSGSLPLIFSYVILSTYFIYGYEKAQDTSMVAFRGGFFWLSYAFVVFIMLKYKQNIILTFLMAISLFTLFNYLLYMYFKHKNIAQQTSVKINNYTRLSKYSK